MLRKNIPNNALSHLKYGVFGQGDSSYTYFNTPAKKLHKRLLQIGALPIVERGDGDDQHYLGVDGALDPWLKTLWKTLLILFPLPANIEILSSEILPPPQYIIKFLDDNSNAFDCIPMKLVDYEVAKVVSNVRMTGPTHFQDIRHIVLEADQLYFIYFTDF